LVLLLAKAVLVAVTLVFLASMGGGMLFAFPVLVPLHWLASRTSGPVGTGGWALLAGLSLFEAGWMMTYVVTDDGALGLVVGAVLGVAVAAAILRSRLDQPLVSSQISR
jgi:hypothetical protein